MRIDLLAYSPIDLLIDAGLTTNKGFRSCLSCLNM